MATTSYVDTGTATYSIGDRTDAAGADVSDYTAEEARLLQLILTEGAVTANAWKVNASSGMTVTVGSGAAKSDVFAVAGEAAGQGVYLARLEAASVNVTVPAADPTARVDEVYLVLADTAYDSGGVSLPRIGYRRGTAGGGAPGPDAAWKASAKLATIAVGGAVTSITAGNITDNRATSALSVPAANALLLGGFAAGAFVQAATATSLLGIDQETSATGTVTSGAWENKAPYPSAVFTAPPTGAVLVTVYAVTDIAGGNSDSAARIGFDIAGPTTVAAADARSVQFIVVNNGGVDRMPIISWSFLLIGLTPGELYTANLAVKGTGGWTLTQAAIKVEIGR